MFAKLYKPPWTKIYYEWYQKPIKMKYYYFQTRQSSNVQVNAEQRSTKERERDRGDRDERKERTEHQPSNRDSVVYNKNVSTSYTKSFAAIKKKTLYLLSGIFTF